jgi:transcriptional coactivator HFI1/ADA1
MSLLAKVTSNGPGNSFIRTASFKRKCAHEERLVDQGNLLKSAARELPVEAEVRRNRRPMCMEDLRLALQLGDGYLGQSPFVAGTIANAKFLDTHGIEDIYLQSKLQNAAAVVVNGQKHPQWLSDGLTVSFPDTGGDTAMADVVDGEAAVGWLGDTGIDGRVLDDALDEVLGLADL